MFIICKTVHEDVLWQGIGIDCIAGLGLPSQHPQAYRLAKAIPFNDDSSNSAGIYALHSHLVGLSYA